LGAKTVGSLAWLHETDGILRRRDYLPLLGQGLLSHGHALPSLLRHRRGIVSNNAAKDLIQVPIPDTEASHAAERLCAQVPAVVNHSYRTYLWGALLGIRDEINYDPEALYVAAVVHDIGFAEQPHTSGGRPCCLAVPAVKAVMELGSAAGWDDARCEVVAEAISLHVNLYVGRERGPIAYLLFAGARLDQIGFRYGDLSRDAVHQVIARYPRENWKSTCCSLMNKQAIGSRCDFYRRRLAGNWFIQHAPFAD
jgi:hypothetical protein